MALQINMNFFTQTISIGSITSIWWVQLSTAIIFGLAFSTMLTLVLIPSMLTLPTNVRDLWGGNRTRTGAETKVAAKDGESTSATTHDEEQHKRADNDDLPVTRPDAAE